MPSGRAVRALGWTIFLFGFIWTCFGFMQRIFTGGLLGPVWTTPVEILLTALLSFVAVGLLAVLIRRIPKVGTWIMG